METKFERKRFYKIIKIHEFIINVVQYLKLNHDMIYNFVIISNVFYKKNKEVPNEKLKLNVRFFLFVFL